MFEVSAALKRGVVTAAKLGAATAAAYTGYKLYSLIEATESVDGKMAIQNAERARKASEAVSRLVHSQAEVMVSTKAEPPKSKEVLIIAAADGVLSLRGVARDLQLNFLRGGVHRDVVVLSFEPVPEDIEAKYKGRVRFVQVTSDDYQSPDRMRSIIGECLKPYDGSLAKVGMACCMGAANLPEGETLERVNINPLINTSGAVIDVAGHMPHMKSITVMSVGSIAPTIIGDACKYTQSRIKADEMLVALAKTADVADGVVVKGVSFRPGIIYGPHMDDAPYVINQMAVMPPFQAIPGSGSGLIPAVSSNDLATAMVNAVDMDKKMAEVVNAVVKYQYTFTQLINHFAKVGKTDVDPIYLPHDFIKVIGKCFPYGKMAEYAGLLFEATDMKEYVPPSSEKFEEFLGREAEKIEDVFPEDVPLDLLPPPLKSHLESVCRAIYKDPKLAAVLARAVYDNKAELASSVVHSVMGAPKPLEKPSRLPQLA